MASFIPQYITLGGISPDTITIALDAAFTQGVSNINKKEIASVQQVFMNLTLPGRENLLAKHRFPYIMRILIKMTASNEDYTFDCQSVANQPTWNVVTNAITAEASLNQANTDISNFL